MTELRRRMIEDMRLNGLAPTTQRAYLAAVQMLAQRYQRSPDQLSEPEIREYFTYLAETKHLARSTINGYLHAIKFLYQKTLQRSWPVLNLIRVPRSKKLPVVLNPQEVWHLLNLIRRPTAQMSLTLMYACGLPQLL
jgi:integrase/recombinase XerD